MIGRRGQATLRGQMIALGLGTAALVIGAVAAPLAVLLRESVRDDANRDASTAALTAADFLSRGITIPDERLVAEYLTRLRERTDIPVSVIRPDDHTVVGAPLSRDERRRVLSIPPGRQDGDHDHDDLRGVSLGPELPVERGQLVQVFVQSPGGPSRVIARIDDRDVSARLWSRYGLLALVVIGLLGLAGIAAEITGRRLARPLQAVAETARALQAGDLTARARAGGPKEVADVAGELNALADRIDDLLLAERETVADLSHRLRTPLTAVRLSAEALPRSPEATELEDHIAHLERALTEVIRSARRPLREGVHARSDAVAVLADRVAFWRPLAEDQGRRVVEELATGPIWVRTSPPDLAAAIDALLENVFAHTPEGTSFKVAITESEDVVVVDVLDDGPGIAADRVPRGRSGDASSGLGLDIARATAVASGGSLELREGPGGGVRLRLGLAR